MMRNKLVQLGLSHNEKIVPATFFSQIREGKQERRGNTSENVNLCGFGPISYDRPKEHMGAQIKHNRLQLVRPSKRKYRFQHFN